MSFPGTNASGSVSHLLQRLLHPRQSAPSSAPPNKQTRDRPEIAPVDTLQPRTFVILRQRMASSAALLKQRLAARRITLAGQSPTQPPRPAPPRAHAANVRTSASRDPRIPVNHSILHQRHLMRLRLLHNLRRQRLLLNRRVALPRRKIHRLARLLIMSRSISHEAGAKCP